MSDFKYQAFISYSHRDRKFAGRLHRTLEHYRVPTELRARNQGMPSRLSPVFKDREDLAVAHSLTDTVRRALKDSRTLVVICSPDSANSPYVDSEIEMFREFRDGEKIFPIVAGGEPPACFPDALLSEGHEPIAADARPEGDGRADATLKLIAGLLGVSFDDLRRREQRRQRNRLMAITSAAMAVALAMLALALMAMKARDDAIHQKRLADLHTQAAVARNLALTSPRAALQLALETAEKQRKLAGEVSDSALSSLLTALDYYREVDRMSVGGGLTDFELSADGSLVVTCSTGGDVKIVELKTGAVGRILQQKGARDIAFGAEDNRVYVASESGEVSAYSAKGKPLGIRWQAHDGAATVARVSFAGQAALLTTGLDSSLKLWTPEGKAIGEPQGIQVPRGSFVGRSPARLACLPALDFSTSLALYEAGSETEKVLPLQSFLVATAAFSPDGKWLATGSVGAEVRLWDAATLNPVGALPGHAAEIVALAFSGDSNLLASADLDGVIRVSDRQGKVLLPPLRGPRNRTQGLAFSPDGQRLISCSSSGTVIVWDIAGFQMRTPLSVGGEVRSLAISPDESRFAVGTADGRLLIYEVDGENDEPLAQVEGFRSFCDPLVATEDGNWIVAGDSTAGKVSVWDWQGRAQGEPVFLGEDTARLRKFVLEPGSPRLHVWTEHCDWVVFDVEQRKILERHRLDGVYRDGRGGGMDPSEIDRAGRMLVGSPYTGEVTVIDVATRTLVSESDVQLGAARIAIHPGAGRGIAAGEDSTTLATFTYPDFGSNRVVQSGFVDGVRRFEFLDQGRRFFACSSSGELRCFSVVGAPLSTVIRAHLGGIEALEWLPERRVLITVGNDGMVRFWVAGASQWLKLAAKRLDIDYETSN